MGAITPFQKTIHPLYKELLLHIKDGIRVNFIWTGEEHSHLQRMIHSLNEFDGEPFIELYSAMQEILNFPEE